MPRILARHWRQWIIGLSLAISAVACSQIPIPLGSSSLNTGYREEQPALSGNGRFLAFVSNRNGGRRVLLYDLQARSLVDLPGLNRWSAIAESPSLSYTGRYIAYIIDDRGKPTIALYDRVNQQSVPITNWYASQVKNPSISPDGRFIVFESGSHGQWDIQLIDRGANIELDIPAALPSPAQGSEGAGEQGKS